jgi:hypothetical protein
MVLKSIIIKNFPLETALLLIKIEFNLILIIK